MIHIYFAVYAILLLGASVTQFGLGSVPGSAKELASRYLSWFHATILLGVLASCVLFYVSPNLLALDPLGSDMGMAYFKHAPALLVFLALCTGAYPFSFFFLYAFLSASSGMTERRARRGGLLTASVALGAWFVGSNLSIPLFFHGDERAKRIICAINDEGMLVLQLFLAGALALFWRRNRAKDGSSTYQDYLVSVMGLVALANVGRFLWMTDTVIGARGPAYDLALLLTDRALLLCLLVDIGTLIRWRLRPREACAATEPGGAGYLRLGIPEGFAERYRLTPREAEIAGLIAAGMANKDIGSRLGISYNTVKNHVSSLFTKLSIESRFEVVARIRSSAASVDVLVNED